MGDNLTRIHELHACKLKSCRNYPKPCVSMPGAGHLQLTVPTIKKWNQRIKDGEATIDNCPADVLDDLLSERNRTSLRKDSKVGMTAGQSGLGPSIVQYFGPGAGPAPDAVVRSSPPAREGDDDQNMRKFMRWLATLYP